jgi:ADP-ribose pyrophosphatase YjhB (NUDIX family)|tara:strand:- start:16 stop:450 length:435 start_codon:yes stop_codon:yes gene_type:complete
MVDKNLMNEFDKGVFVVNLLAVIYDPKKKKFLIVRRENDPHFKELSWVFPGERPDYGERLGVGIKRIIKEHVGYNVEILGEIFSKVYPEKEEFLSIYYLCEITDGEESLSDLFKESKWVAPEEIEEHFTTSFHPRLKEYLMGLK